MQVELAAEQNSFGTNTRQLLSATRKRSFEESNIVEDEFNEDKDSDSKVRT